MTQAALNTSINSETDIGHTAFSSIKDYVNLIDENLETVIAAVPSAIDDGLSQTLALEAVEYLSEIQRLSSQMRSLHLKAHAKFKVGIETAPAGSKFSSRAPT